MSEMKWAFERLSEGVLPPQKVEHPKGFSWRYKEQTVQQALLLKLFRLTSNLDAARVLLSLGKVMECGALKRLIDEANDDILFMAAPLLGHPKEDIHDEYLRYFWEEEFDVPGEPMKSSQKRGMVRRDKIQAYNARLISPKDPSTAKKVDSSIFKTYSGYIHGHSQHIMDAYDGKEFHIRIEPGMRPYDATLENFLSYPYRCVMASSFIANAFGDGAVQERLMSAYRSIGD
ncbi:MAG: hypothetical protein EOR67_09340 [Mesorhizobium sp.]|uniref:hypothetical protein n=1 Tax=Mesorhizobium sp. TaxID=1871066 RepID=UPI000FE99812|nr:hypothetical protein [Mesorhizobium sp.]RWL86990.1 MAG: hypothetical protein EOR69_04300 [Mesorhizobium sp.]RWL89613.1 MAG: hypothetical protein EOR67_09340 [Mesorhizobium sp.]RWM01642.1 MAG: hypothetical protein EOR70_07650 [Mesorhizobium sp.]